MHRAFRKYRAVLIAIALLASVLTPVSAQSPATSTLTFNGTDFHHRWSKSGQHEFTPAGQEDLSRWQDMITLIVKSEVRTAEQLAGLANALLANFERSGKILVTDSRPMTADEPAEHLIVAMLPGDTFIEVVFARTVLVDETGMFYLYARRIYGPDVSEDGSAWINDNASSVASAWTQWRGAPSLPELKVLPESD